MLALRLDYRERQRTTASQLMDPVPRAPPAGRACYLLKGRAANIICWIPVAARPSSAWSSARRPRHYPVQQPAEAPPATWTFAPTLVDQSKTATNSGTVPFGCPKDPAYSFSGNLGHTEIALPTRGLGLLFGRAYNSRDLFGPGWTCSVEWKGRHRPPGRLRRRARRRRPPRPFDLAPDGSYVGDFGVRHHLQALAEGRWQLTLSCGVLSVLRIGRASPEAIAHRNGNRQQIEGATWPAGARASDTTGRFVELEYDAEGMPRAGRDSAGRQVSYSFDATEDSPCLTIPPASERGTRMTTAGGWR